MAAATAPTSFHIRRSFNYNANLQNSFPKVRSVKAPSIITANSLRAPRPQNVSGEFFVDHTCIDCDTCRWMAPENFTRAGDMSAVFKQPSCEEERLRALQALLSCPTRSIHTEKPPHDILEVQKTFPIPIDEHTLPGVYHCGYHSDKSFGAASYLIVRAEGNILVDSPRYTTKLENNLKMLGGARYMFLTHSDDVADHEKWSNHLGCERILHSLEVDHSTAAVEIKLEGSGPWSLSDDVTLVHTPGHTEGSVCLLYKPRNVLFTGDHFAMGERGWTIFERYNKLSGCKLHDVFHVSLLKPFKGEVPTTPPTLPPVEEGRVVPTPCSVLRSNLNCDNWEILVHWCGQSVEDYIWETVHHFKSSFPDFKLEDKLFLRAQAIEQCEVDARLGF